MIIRRFVYEQLQWHWTDHAKLIK